MAKLAMIVAGVLSFLVAILHLAIVFAGASWYRFFGAGEEMAIMAEQGSWIPAIVTLGIALVFAIWAAYAFSAVGLLAKLPFQKIALVTIATIYTLRGLGVLVFFIRPELATSFNIWSSLVSLLIGLLYAYGTYFLEFNNS